MKAAIMYGPNDIRVEETEKPACPKGGLLLKVKAIGLCGSDIRNLTTDSRKGDYPHIYGAGAATVKTVKMQETMRTVREALQIISRCLRSSLMQMLYIQSRTGSITTVHHWENHYLLSMHVRKT